MMRIICLFYGHKPGVIWFIDGLPYPPSDFYGEQECSFVGGGVLEFRGFCTRCWNHFDIPWPRKNPDYELDDYVKETYPNAVFFHLRVYEFIRDTTQRELQRINGNPNMFHPQSNRERSA